MSSLRPIPEALLHAAEQVDPHHGFRFVDEIAETFYSFEELAAMAARYAAALLRAGLHPGDRVALALPDNDEFVLSFLGAMHAGLVPVPMYPPQGLKKLGFYLEHAGHILHTSSATMLITSAQMKTVLGSLLKGNLRFISTVKDLAIDNTQIPPARLRPEDPAFLQFTSGSTSRPKGVLLTYSNISANTRCIAEGLKVNREDVGCAWLPLYHDMGLIGFVLTPIANCIPVVLMSPYVFLKHPVEWLRRITRHRATVSFAPNFGYRLCTTRIRERDEEALDLSSWRVAGCGAEPIQIATLERFSARFDSVGFSGRSFVLAYGLAENTLAVSFSSSGNPLRSERVRADTLTRGGTAAPADPADASAVTVANCGRPFPGHELAVVDGNGRPSAPRQIGEIATCGPSVMRGYYNDPQATAAAIKNGWLHTGDLGFLSDGELFVCGRIKELIIAAGRNYYPADIEWIVSGIPGVRLGRVVAFGVGGNEGSDESERIVICAEAKISRAHRDDAVARIRARIFETLGLRVSDVVLLNRNRLPRTSSGKLQRGKTREMYLNGSLEAASDEEGKLMFFRHLVISQWGFLKHRVTSAVFGGNRP